MNDRRTIIRAPALAVALVVALLLLAGMYTVLASPAPSTAAGPAQDLPNAGTYWTSGWVTINQNEVITLTHNLGGNPDDYAVDLWFNDTDGTLGVNRRNYGGLEHNNNWYGARWQRLTTDTIQIYRYPQDDVADQVRVTVWIPTAVAEQWDSGWVDINQHETLIFDHNLNSETDDLTVSLYFRSTGLGIHQAGFGGLSIDAPAAQRGAYWHNLTDNTVQVTRMPDDPYIEQVRVVVQRPNPPDYDSGWQHIEAGNTFNFNHNLNWNPGMLLVRGECYDPSSPDGLGVNLRYAGGDHDGGWRGMNLQNLTANAVRGVRRADDPYCPQARVRIWKRSTTPQFRLYLPLVLNNSAPEVELAYDDGVGESEQTQITLGSGFAVRFTTPGASARLVRARYYLDTAAAGHPIQVHVWDAAHTDLIAPFTATPPAGMGWFDVDLSGYNLTVSGDFYVGFLYSVQHSDPSVGVDTTSPDGRSYEVPWEAFANDFMIRAVVQGP